MSNIAALPVDALASSILSGDLPASAALGRPDVYDALNAPSGKGASTFGRLPFLGTSSKIDAGLGAGVLSVVLYMQPANASGREACPGRSDGCTAACLAEGTGRMSMSGPQQARRRRHASFYADRKRFLADLHVEVTRHVKRAAKMGKTCAVRLNGTTDLPWHKMPYTDHDGVKHANIHSAFPAVKFYEYTKRPLSQQGKVPANLHLTFSYSERDDAAERALAYLAAGHGVAAVFNVAKGNLPDTWSIPSKRGPGAIPAVQVIDGDKHDARFLDPRGVIVGLSAKGRAKHDTSGFVQAVAA
jgi:hypothetical protein